jgi:hypothetical protein
MTSPTNLQILKATRDWYLNLVESHKQRSRTFLNESKLNINPFTVHYLAKVVGGNCDAESIARALLYPRILGTSINTSFGTEFQKFIVSQLRNAFGSVVSGMDIEFIDHLDGRRKYCQLKLGTDTINHDDVKTILDKFKQLLRFAKTNNLDVRQEDVVLGVLVGEYDGLNANYRQIEDDNWSVIVGRDFWKRLTGDETMMDALVLTIQDVAKGIFDEGWLENLVRDLANQEFIKNLAI